MFFALCVLNRRWPVLEGKIACGQNGAFCQVAGMDRTGRELTEVVGWLTNDNRSMFQCR